MIEVLYKNPGEVDTCHCCVTLNFYPQTSQGAILYNMRKQFNLDEIAIYPYLGPPNNDCIMVELAGKREYVDGAIAWAMSMGVRLEIAREI
ncbi:MAG: hypothetical protein PHH57_08700 [Candidatus Omnitrophica bacterium]|nr:hypothetical protein [Candidatus Omnitrophota bacterium]